MLQNLSLFTLIAIAVVLIVATIILTLRSIKRAPGKLAHELEADAFRVVGLQLQALTSHAADVKMISAAQARIHARMQNTSAFYDEFGALLFQHALQPAADSQAKATGPDTQPAQEA